MMDAADAVSRPQINNKKKHLLLLLAPRVAAPIFIDDGVLVVSVVMDVYVSALCTSIDLKWRESDLFYVSVDLKWPTGQYAMYRSPLDQLGCSKQWVCRPFNDKHVTRAGPPSSIAPSGFIIAISSLMMSSNFQCPRHLHNSETLNHFQFQFLPRQDTIHNLRFSPDSYWPLFFKQYSTDQYRLSSVISVVCFVYSPLLTTNRIHSASSLLK